MSIPSELVAPLIELYADGGNITSRAIAQAAGVDESAVMKWRNGTRARIEFPMVDRLLCAMDMADRWYAPPLNAYYLEHNLTHPLSASSQPKARCARRGCSNTLPPKSHHGGQPRKYCSVSCQDKARKQRRGAMKPHSQTSAFMCRSGLHERSPETIEITKDGVMRCMPCNRAAYKRYRERKKARGDACRDP